MAHRLTGTASIWRGYCQVLSVKLPKFTLKVGSIAASYLSLLLTKMGVESGSTVPRKQGRDGSS
jgi:hypothetical protein